MIALLIFLVTLVLIFIRPKGIKEVWFAAAGALLAWLFGLVDAEDARGLFADTGGVLLFLAGVLVITSLTDRAGVFERMAQAVARLAQGDGRRLFAGIYLIGVFVTIWLSLDTTAVILAPIVYNLARLVRVSPLPFVFATTYVANTASLLLPVSNLTNLIVWGRLKLPFWEFARVMLLPSMLAIGVNLGLLFWLFRKEVPRHYDERLLAASPASVAHAHGREREMLITGSWALGLILIAIGLAPLFKIELWHIACAGALLLAAYHLVRTGLTLGELARNIPWDLIPFVFSLFLIMRAVAKTGLSEWAAGTVLTWAAGQSFGELLTVALATALGSNLINNLPMILAVMESLATPVTNGQLDIATLYGALIGTNLGPNLTVIGSLATMLSLSIIGKKGLRVSGLLYLKIGLLSVPLLLLAAVFGLWLTLHF